MASLVVASLALRLLLSWERPLWFDELFTLWAARLPLSGLIRALRLDSGPPGFYLLEKPFASAADRLPQADALLRAPTFLATLLLFWAARSLPRGAARSTFLLLLSGSALINLYSGEARPYALLALLCMALFLWSLRGEETARRLLLLAGVAALCLYTHYIAVFAVTSLAILTAAARRWGSFAALLAGAALFAPWVPVLLAQPAAAVAWMHESTSGSALGFLSALGGVGRFPSPFGRPAPPLLFFAGAAAGAWALVWLLARSRFDRDARESAAFVLLVLGGALTAAVWKPIAFAGRTELAVLPVWIWGLARAAPASRPVRGACAAIASLGFLGTLAVALHSHGPPVSVAVTESIGRVAKTGDVVLAATSFYLPAELAFERGRLAARVLSMPSGLAAHPGWFLPLLPGRDEEDALRAAVAQVPPGGRLFLVLPPAYATAGLDGVLASVRGRVRSLMRSPDALVTLWTRDPARPQIAPAER